MSLLLPVHAVAPCLIPVLHNTLTVQPAQPRHYAQTRHTISAESHVVQNFNPHSMPMFLQTALISLSLENSFKHKWYENIIHKRYSRIHS